MLVLSREVDQTIIIDRNIEVKILSIKEGAKVRVGIDAPKSIAVHRGEVQAAIDAGAKETRNPSRLQAVESEAYRLRTLLSREQAVSRKPDVIAAVRQAALAEGLTDAHRAALLDFLDMTRATPVVMSSAQRGLRRI